jgi:hypothetical protein
VAGIEISLPVGTRRSIGRKAQLPLLRLVIGAL